MELIILLSLVVLSLSYVLAKELQQVVPRDAVSTNERSAVTDGDDVICKGLPEAFWRYFQGLSSADPEVARVFEISLGDNLGLDISDRDGIRAFACQVAVVKSIPQLTELLQTVVPSGDADYDTLYHRWVRGYRVRGGSEGLIKGIHIKDRLLQFLLSSGVSDPHLPWQYVRNQLDPFPMRDLMLQLREEYGPGFLTSICVEPQDPIYLHDQLDIDNFVVAALESTDGSEFASLTGLDLDQVSQLNMAMSTLMTRNQKLEELEVVMMAALDQAGLLNLKT